MNETKGPGYVFQDKQSGGWFYIFSRDWVTYRSNQGFKTMEEAKEAKFKKWQSLLLAE